MVTAQILRGVLALAVGVVPRLADDRDAARPGVGAVPGRVGHPDHDVPRPGPHLRGARLSDRHGPVPNRELGAMVAGPPALDEAELVA